jgi:hypothetical protein
VVSKWIKRVAIAAGIGGFCYMYGFISMLVGSKGIGMKKPIMVDDTMPGDDGWRGRVADWLINRIDNLKETH